MKLNRHRHSNLPRTEHQHLFFGSLSRRKTQIAERSDRVTERSETQVVCRCAGVELHTEHARGWGYVHSVNHHSDRRLLEPYRMEGTRTLPASTVRGKLRMPSALAWLASTLRKWWWMDGTSEFDASNSDQGLGRSKDSCLFVVDLGRRLEYFARSRYTSANTSLLHPSTLVRTVSSRRRHISNEVGRRETRAYS